MNRWLGESSDSDCGSAGTSPYSPRPPVAEVVLRTKIDLEMPERKGLPILSHL